jgi:transposase
VLDCITSLQNGADLLWIETEKPHIGQIGGMVNRIREVIPNAKLVYNNSPSFNWTLNFRQQVFDAWAAEGKDVSAYDRAKLMSVDYDDTELAAEADERIRTFQRDAAAQAGIFHHLITLPTYHTAALSTDNLAKEYFGDARACWATSSACSAGNPPGHRLREAPEHVRLDIGDDHKEYFAGEAALKAGGKDNTMNQFAPCVGRVVVVNPSQFKVIRKSVKKTDKNDAAALALFLEKDMLPETRVKTSAENELASLAHTRDLLVKQRTRLLNKIHALHVGKGLKLKKESLGSKRGLAAIDMALFSPCEQVEITVLRETALSLTASLKQLDTEIEKHASALTGYEGIVSIKGVGPRSAAVLLAAIGNVHDFESADKLAAYFGMVPRVAQSNETDHRGRITKRGNKLARTTLVQCSLVATRYSPYLKNFHERIRQRRGTGKAIIATARKLLSIIYDTLKNGWVFSDFTTFSRSEPTLAAGQSS